MLYLRNTTLNTIFDDGNTGISFAPGELVEASEFKINNENLRSLIDDGSLVLTNGTIDFSADEALNRIDWRGLNFSLDLIQNSVPIIIPINQQNIVYQQIEIEDGAELILSGSLIILE